MREEQIEAKIKRDEERLSWADFQYYSLTKIFNSRQNGELQAYRAGVNALEMILAGHRDDFYYRDLTIVNSKKEQVREERGAEVADLFYYDEKLTALSELIFRINRGVDRVRQRFINSDLAKELAYKLTTGTGQNIFITGSPGSGKSYTGIAIALELERLTGVKFNPKNVVFSPKEFLDVYNDEKLTPPGSTIIYDEAGVTFNSKDTSQEASKLFEKLLMTIRHRAVCVVFTAPDLSNIALTGRKLLHWWLKTEKINKKAGLCTIKPFTVEVDQRTGKILFPYPVYDGKQLGLVDVEKIPEKVAAKYEARAKEYKDNLALSTEMEYGFIENNKVAQLKKFIKLRSQGLKISEACDVLAIHRNTGSKLEKMRLNSRLAHFAHEGGTGPT